MNNTINDFIVAAANELTGNISGALYVSGETSYENFVWNTDLYKVKQNPLYRQLSSLNNLFIFQKR